MDAIRSEITNQGYASVPTGSSSVPNGGLFITGQYSPLRIYQDGSYRYALDDGYTQLNMLAEGQVVYEVFTYEVRDTAGNTDTATLTLKIVGTNDAPMVISGPGAGNVTEAGDDDTGADTPGSPTANGTLSAFDVDQGTTLTWSGDAVGTYGSFAITAGGAWTYTLDNTDPQTQALYEGEVVTDTFTATVSDGMASRTQTVTITITGANDAPVVTAETSSTTEDAVVYTGSVADNASDVDAGATETFALVNAPDWISMDSAGTYTVSPGHSAFQALKQGEVATYTVDYTVTDDKDAVTPGTIALTVTGSNDAPVITSGPADAAGSVRKSGSNDNGTADSGTPSATGTLTSSDVDHDATATWSGAGTSLYGSFAVASNGVWTYTLDNTDPDTQVLYEGQVVTEVFTATVSDGLGGSASETVTVTITGTNDAPVVTAAAASGTEDTGTVTGSVAGNASDVDAGATETFALVGSPSWITMAADGSYAINTADAAFQALAAGAEGAFTANYTVTDDKLAVTQGTLTVSVTGANDAPTVTAVAGTPVNLQERPENQNDNFAPQMGTLTVNDVDNPDTVTGVIVGSPTVTFNGSAPSGATQTAIANGLTSGEGGSGSALTFGSASPNGIATTLDWTYNPGSVNLKTLSEEDTVTITYTVRVNDGTADSAETQQIVINVRGFNNVFSGDANGEPTDDTITGTGNADDIYGNDGDDSINAGGGNDDVFGGAGDDSILGGGGNDTVEGGDGDDTLDGASGADTLDGGAGDDNLSGGSENDTFYVGSGNAVVNGGSGADTLHLDGSWTSYTITRAGSNTYSIEGTEGEIVASFVENFVFDGNTAPTSGGPFTAAQILNDAPVAGNDTGASGNVLNNDNDADATLGDTETVTGIRTGTEAAGGTFSPVAADTTITGTYGTLTINPDGTYSYAVDPADPQTLALGTGTGTETFTYQMKDAKGLADTAQISITVTGTNAPPVANDDSYSTAEDIARTFTAAELVGNDTDANGNSLSVQSVSNATGGTAVLNGDGTVTFTPTPNFNGTAGFDYVVSDGAGGTDTGHVTVTVTSVNDAPMANADSFTTNEDTPLSVAVSTLTGNDTDIDDDALTVTSVGNATSGTVVLSGGQVVFTPTANFHGVAGYDYSISDGNGGTSTAHVTVTVTPVNDAPVANADSFTTDEDTPLAVATSTLTGNDTDADSDALTVTSVGNATDGTVALSGGQVVFTPDANFHGVAGYDYTISDGNGGTSTAHVTVTVTSVNDNPVAAGESFTTGEDTTLSVAASTLVANDVDADGDALTVTGVGNATNGTVALSGGQITFTPASNYSGPASFDYTVSDSNGGTSTATVSVTVTAINDAPVANDDTLNATEGTPVTFTAGQLLGNDSDVDNALGDLSIDSVTSGPGGTAVLNGDGSVTFTPDANFNGPATFTYTATDGSATSAPATAAVNVTGVNDAPVANADSLTTSEDTPLTIPGSTLTANDTDADGNTLTVVGVSNATNGSVSLSGGQITFTPTADFHGTATFDYTVSDGNGGSSTATVTVTVGPVNDAPVANADVLSATEDTPATFTAGELTGNDTDVDGDALTLVSVTSGAGGTASLAGGVVTFTPDANFNGPAGFTYQVSDGTTTTTGTATVNVAAVNDMAVITGTRTGSVTEDGTLTTNGDVDVADPDTGEAKFAGASGARAGTYGTYTFNVDTGVWSYQLNNANAAVQALNAGQMLTNSITVQSLDGSASTTLDVTINGADEPMTGIVGANGDDNLNGTAAPEDMYGLDGNDTLNGSAGADRLFGGNGTDTANYSASAIAVNVSLAVNAGIGGDAAGDTYDSVENVTGSGLADTLVGDGNANSLNGGAGNDTLNGGGGNDVLTGGTGNDAMFGGTGDDTYEVDSATDTVTEAANEGTDLVRTMLTTYTLGTNVENLTYTGAAAFTGNGNALANIITGASGADKLDGKAGADTMVGALGNDTYTVDDAGDQVVELSGEGIDLVNSSVDYTLGANVENLTLVGAALNATGNGLDNILKGTTGVVNSRIDGGAGADNMFGYEGDDTYVVDSTGDIVNEATGGGVDTIETTLNTLTLRTFVEKLVFTGTGDFIGTGNAENNTILGGSGNDRLDGRTGVDTMNGGAGNDYYAVDNVGDVIVEAIGGGNDEVFVAATDYTVSDYIEKVTMGGTARNLVAGAGNTVILGNGQVNRIDGGAGADTITGYSGNDTFVFQLGQANGDTVTDFTGAGIAGGDLLELRGYGTLASGAGIARLGATDSYVITADAAHGGATETITLTGVFGLNTGDVVFI